MTAVNLKLLIGKLNDPALARWKEPQVCAFRVQTTTWKSNTGC